jgi:hypothetical protein
MNSSNVGLLKRFAARSFYIRFAKITVRKPLQAALPPNAEV